MKLLIVLALVLAACGGPQAEVDAAAAQCEELAPEIASATLDEMQADPRTRELMETLFDTIDESPDGDLYYDRIAQSILESSWQQCMEAEGFDCGLTRCAVPGDEPMTQRPHAMNPYR